MSLFEDEVEAPAKGPPDIPGNIPLLSPLESLGLGDTCWGLDPSTKRWAASILLPGGAFKQEVMPVYQVQGDEPGRLAKAHADLLNWFTILGETHGAPTVAVAEQPFAFGRNVHPQSYYMLGVGLAALRAVYEDLVIIPLGPSQWKSTGLGKGHGLAKKPAILNWAIGLGQTETCRKCGDGSGYGPKQDCKEGSVAHDYADSLAMAVAAARKLMG